MSQCLFREMRSLLKFSMGQMYISIFMWLVNAIRKLGQFIKIHDFFWIYILIICQTEDEISYPFVYYYHMSNRLQYGSVPSPTCNDSIRASYPSSTHSHKPTALFLTQKKQNPYEAEILQRHAELNGYIEQLDAKVQRIVEHNEAELLFAYRNHLEAVRMEMEQFKEQTQQAFQSEAINLQKIDIMEKQLIVFREEALKMFDKALKKDKEIQHLQRRLEECLSEKGHMDFMVKALIKKNKELEAVVKAEDQRRTRTQQEYLGRVQVNSFVSLGITSHKKMVNRDKRIRDRILTKTSNNNSKSFTQDHLRSKQETKPSYMQIQPLPKQQNPDAELFARSLKMKLSYIQPTLLENVVDSVMEIFTFFDHRSPTVTHATQKETFQIPHTKSSLRSKSYHTWQSNSREKRSISRYTHYRQPQETSDNMDLKECFRKSVQMIRKQIARRKQINSLNFFKQGSPISLEDFKKMDFIKIMEMVFADQKMIQVVYWNLFSSAS